MPDLLRLRFHMVLNAFVMPNTFGRELAELLMNLDTQLSIAFSMQLKIWAQSLMMLLASLSSAKLQLELI